MGREIQPSVTWVRASLRRHLSKDLERGKVIQAGIGKRIAGRGNRSTKQEWALCTQRSMEQDQSVGRRGGK